jgi:hypothetical protein
MTCIEKLVFKCRIQPLEFGKEVKRLSSLLCLWEMRHKIVHCDIKVLLIVTFLDGMPLNVWLHLKFLERYLREGDRLVLIFPS